MRTLYKVSTFLILALGILHLSLTPVIFRNLTQSALWFASGGLMIIFVSFFNLILLTGAGKERRVRMLCYTANLIGLIFACLMFILEFRRGLPELSTWLVLALLVFETLAAFRYSSR